MNYRNYSHHCISLVKSTIFTVVGQLVGTLKRAHTVNLLGLLFIVILTLTGNAQAESITIDDWMADQAYLSFSQTTMAAVLAL